MSVAIVPVKLTCESRTEDVVALYTTACGISSMSERLAEKLGIVHGKAELITNAGIEYYGHLPDRVVYVDCAVFRASEGSGVISVPVAFLIMPEPHDELVLGGEWSTELQQQEPGMAILSGPWKDPINFPGLTYMRIHTGTPTRGPGFIPGCVMSIYHIIEIEDMGIDALEKLVQEEKQRRGEALLLASR